MSIAYITREVISHERGSEGVKKGGWRGGEGARKGRKEGGGRDKEGREGE